MSSRETPVPQDSVSDKLLAPYLTPRQLTDLLQLSVKTIYRWAETDPTMPALRAGVVRFPRERVLAWLRNREQGAGRAVSLGNRCSLAATAQRCAMVARRYESWVSPIRRHVPIHVPRRPHERP